MSYNPSDKPTVPQLCTELSSVTNWQYFAMHLPGIEMKHIKEIESDCHGIPNRKRFLFDKWLGIHPGAAWSDVRSALMEMEEVTLATSLVKQPVHHIIDSSPMSLAPPPQQVPSPPQQQQTLKQFTFEEKEEIGIKETLVELHEMFADIIYEVKTEFTNLVTQQLVQLQDIVRFAESAINPLQVVKLNASNLKEFFDTLHPYYDFLDCGVLIPIVKKFAGQKLARSLQAHSAKANKLRGTVPIKQLAKDLHHIFIGFDNLPILDVKLETPWVRVAISGLYVLIQHLLPDAVKKHPQFSLMNNIVIAEGSLILQYAIRDPSMIDTIIQHVQSNIDLMTLIGVFQIAVDDRYVIHEDENPSFSFNVSLLKAAEANNNVAVQFLIDIRADVNYQHDDGSTALMLAAGANNDVGVGLLLAAGASTDIVNDGLTALMYAVGVNNIDIIHYLLQAGADVNIKKKEGIMALMLACGGSRMPLPPGLHRLSNDYSDAVRLLLSHGADPIADLDDDVPFSAFHMACMADNSNIVEVLLTDCNIPPEAVGRGLYCALLLAAIFTIKLLQPKIPDVDPLAIKLGVACGEGDTETVKSLIEQGVDPNTSIVHGLTPLMIASCCGHIDVVDTLLLQGVDVNKVDDIVGCTALDNTEDDNIASLLKLNGAVHGKQVTPTNKSQGSSAPHLPSFNIHDLIDKPFRSLKQTQQQLPHFNVFIVSIIAIHCCYLLYIVLHFLIKECFKPSVLLNAPDNTILYNCYNSRSADSATWF